MKSTKNNSIKLSKGQLNTLKSKNLNESTNASYLHYYEEFLKHINKPPKLVNSSDIAEYLSYLKKNKCAYSTFNINLNALKIFHEKLFLEDSLKNIKRPKIKNLNMDVLSHEEVINIINNLNNLKHKTIFCITYYCGLKSSEIVKLKISHIDSKKKKIKVPPINENKEPRIVDIPEETEKILTEYIENFQVKDWLFPGKPSNKPYSVRSLQRLFTEIAIKFGISKILTPITVRRSRAVELQKKGYDWIFIKNFLGHEGKDTTKRFYRELSKA